MRNALKYKKVIRVTHLIYLFKNQKMQKSIKYSKPFIFLQFRLNFLRPQGFGLSYHAQIDCVN